jgi:tetratricopeptide (TPR) repeat protein
LTQVIEEEGVGVAKKKYNELREEFYGGFSYDFSERVLTRVAETLAGQGKFTEAIELIELELEHYPESLYAHFVLAGAYKESGNKDAAIETLKKALSFAPDSQKPFLQRQLEELKGS